MEEVQKVLDELKGVRPEKLTGEAKRLFEAIMKIADERDELLEKNKRNKKIILAKLDKLKYGIENDFPVTLGKQQPLWDGNYTKFVDKDKIRELLEQYDKDIAWANVDDHYYFTKFIKELLEE